MSPSWIDIFLGLLPMLLLIAAWFVFMRAFSRPGGIRDQQMKMTERQVRALERMADALERRNVQ